MTGIVNAKLVFPDRIFEGNLLMDGETILKAGDCEIPSGVETIDAGGLYVGPGLIDEHVHGFHRDGVGYDIIDNTEAVAREHLKRGTTGILPSPSYSLRMDRFLEIIDQCDRAIERNDTSILGIHLEGPYINYRMGAGRKYAWKYSDEAFERLFTAGKGNVRMCTYAPEMEYAESVEAMIDKYGVVAAMGHTSADPDSIYRAVSKGLKIVTHMFDATGHYKGIKAFEDTGDPQDGVSYVAMGIEGLYYEIISDAEGAHVTVPSQRLAWRVGGEDHVILVSDCTFHHRAEDNGMDINLNAEGKLFGSKLTVGECAHNFKKATGIGIRETFKCASTNSAKALGLYEKVGSIEPGKRADMVFVDDEFNVKKVIFRGKVVE